MLCLFLVAHSSLFAPSKIEKQYPDLPVCPAGQPAERGDARGLQEGVLSIIKDLKKIAENITHYYLL